MMSHPTQRLRLLILGGTADATRLATAIAAEPGIDAVLSFAGRTDNPRPPPIPWRVGGFGGVPGLIDYLRAERIDRVVDATHPFAAQMSRNAVEACAVADPRTAPGHAMNTTVASEAPTARVASEAPATLPTAKRVPSSPRSAPSVPNAATRAPSATSEDPAPGQPAMAPPPALSDQPTVDEADQKDTPSPIPTIASPTAAERHADRESNAESAAMISTHALTQPITLAPRIRGAHRSASDNPKATRHASPCHDAPGPGSRARIDKASAGCAA
jgi:hypothetical protein